MKKDYQKALRNLTLFFLSNPVPFKGQSYQKQKGSRTSHQSLFRSQNKFKKILLFVIYYLTKSELFQKLHLQIYASHFMTSCIIPLSFVLLNLESLERKGKITKK